jgi:hypothetical protein
MDEKIFLGVISIITALSPIIFNYIFKRLETRNETSLRTRILDEAQKRFDFLGKYYQVQSAFLEGDKLTALKSQLSEEAGQVKNSVTLSYKEPEIREHGKLSSFQRIFLTFKPSTIWGWILLFIAYFDSVFILFILFGYSIDPVTNESSGQAFIASLKDSGALTGLIFFIVILVICRWLALKIHDSAIRKKEAPVVVEEK